VMACYINCLFFFSWLVVLYAKTYTDLHGENQIPDPRAWRKYRAQRLTRIDEEEIMTRSKSLAQILYGRLMRVLGSSQLSVMNVFKSLKALAYIYT
jgi:hypothetical protein